MIYDELLKNDHIPRIAKVSYEIEKGNIENLSAEIRRQLERVGGAERIFPGATIALTGSSREITDLDVILREIACYLKGKGARPFIVPAMGSHGGATAEGQREILKGYGITEEKTGIPVISSMETVCIGTSESGLPVYIDKNAAEADFIVIVGRIKPHTDFRGKVESGLMKMMAIGLGKQQGAAICHREGFSNMSRNVLEFARVVLRQTNVLFGVGIIEDFFHHTYKIEAIEAERMEEREEELLRIAKRLIPCIPFEKIDVLVVHEIGKDISGSGMDPNVTGRSGQLGISKPFAQRIAVLDLTEKSHHNGAGVGLADVTTKRFFEKIRFDMTYPNGITACDVSGMKIPPVMPNDKLAVKHAIHIATEADQNKVKLVWIKNTCSMDCFYISEALMREAETVPGIRVLEAPHEMQFDVRNNLISDWT